MIVKKHLKPARKADMRRAATLPTTGKKVLEPVTKVANAAMAAAENRNLETVGAQYHCALALNRTEVAHEQPGSIHHQFHHRQPT